MKISKQEIQEAEDRLAIRELVDNYAYCADTRKCTWADGTLYSRYTFCCVHGQ